MAATSYAARVTARLPGILAQHPGWTVQEARRFARGHGAPGKGNVTPEHGSPATKIAQGTVRSSAGQVSVRATARDSQVIRDVNRAADSGARVQVGIHTKGTGWQQIGRTNRGYSASYVADKIAQHGGDVRSAIAELLSEGGNHYDLRGFGSATQYTGAADAWEITAYES